MGNEPMEIRKSDVVLSLAGRDRGGLYFVLQTEDGFCWLADGSGRRVEKPKRKKLRHLRHVCRGDGETAQRILRGDPVTNKELRRTLKALREGIDGAIEEG